MAQSAAFMRKLRKKYRLGEFSSKRRARRWRARWPRAFKSVHARGRRRRVRTAPLRAIGNARKTSAKGRALRRAAFYSQLGWLGDAQSELNLARSMK